MNRTNAGRQEPLGKARVHTVPVLAVVLSLAAVSRVPAVETADLATLVAKPAELSPWAYPYRADLKVQKNPEAWFVLRRLERLDRVYRPVDLLLARDGVQDNSDRHAMLPAPRGGLRSALLWEGRVPLKRVELHWPNNAPAPPVERVEVRVYSAPFGWFGWQADQRVTIGPAITQDGSTWVYQSAHPGDSLPVTACLPPRNVGLAWGGTTTGKPDEVDMVAVFVQTAKTASKNDANAQAEQPVPQILAYGPEEWKRIDVEIEWGFTDETSTASYDGRLEGSFGVVGQVAPLPGDTGTAMVARDAWNSQATGAGRRGIAASLLYIQPAIELVNGMPRFPYGHPRDTRITVWTRSGSFTFLLRDLEKGPILAPEYGFFVTRTGSGITARKHAVELAARTARSIRQMTREHREASWDDAMREINLPLLPRGTTLPPYKQVADPPMQVQVPEARWVDAWRMCVSKLQTGELTYMNLALEAPRPIHDMDLVGLHDAAARWLETFLQRPGTPSDGDFEDGSGNFCIGKLFHETAAMSYAGISHPGYDTYELVHNGGTGRILYDLAEHYFLTGDAHWFKENQWRMQAAAEWIIRQRTHYMNDVPNRNALAVSGLHPPQHIADCAWGQSEWKWYAMIDAWYYQGLHRFGEAMGEVDPSRAARYLDEAKQYRKAIEKAVDRAVTLAPVIQVRNGTYRSYIPPIFYIRGPSIGQVTQIAMTDVDWSLELVNAAGIPPVNDIRVDGHLDVCEDTLAVRSTYLHGGNRFQFLTERRREQGLSPTEDWFWGGHAPQLGYSFLANVYLQRDEVPSFLRQWVNNYAAFVMPTPEYCFLEHLMNHADPGVNEAFRKGEYRQYLNGHALSFFMEQFRDLLVWEDAGVLWLAKATPRHWLAHGKTISVKNAPTCFGTVAYKIVSDVDSGKISATVEIPSRNPPKAVLLRLRHPKALPIKSVTVNGRPWRAFQPEKETIELKELAGKVIVVARYQ